MYLLLLEYLGGKNVAAARCSRWPAWLPGLTVCLAAWPGCLPGPAAWRIGCCLAGWLPGRLTAGLPACAAWLGTLLPSCLAAELAAWLPGWPAACRRAGLFTWLACFLAGYLVWPPGWLAGMLPGWLAGLLPG